MQVQALDGDIVLCSWARLLTLTVPLSTQVYNLMLGITLRWTRMQSMGEVEILLIKRFMLQKPEISAGLKLNKG